MTMKPIYGYLLGLCLLGTIVPKALAGEPAYRGSLYYEQRASLFRSLPTTKGATIFLGNSITDGSEWGELFPGKRILNRGISGDVTRGVLARLDEIVRHEPAKVFLLIGINDLAGGRAADQVCRDIFLIVRQIRQQSPQTKVYVQSILPVHSGYKKFASISDKGTLIKEINKVLASHATREHYTYIDLHTQMADGAGELREEFTNDGLHLMGAAYTHWARLIAKYLD